MPADLTWASRAVETALDAIVTIDERGTIVHVNAGAERMFACPRAEAVGRELAGLIAPEDEHAELAADLRSIGAGHRIELVAVRGTGERFPIELALTRA